MKNLLKSGRCFVFLWVFVVLVAVQGCRKDPPPKNNDIQINEWILENMEFWYLWNTQIPGKTDKTLNPKDYFESLLYKAEDRFSWIQEDFTELMKYLSGVTTEAGYEFELFYFEKGSNRLIGCITYIKPGTPAEAAGLKRGDFFTSINRIDMTDQNYKDLLNQISEAHTIGKVNLNTGQTTSVSLQVIEYEENPILLDTIYDVQSKKIGYLVYNFFARDSKRYGIAYEKELNELFGKFKSKGIDELIIDLRYNSGGTVVTAEALASMISNRDATDIFGYELYNSILGQELAGIHGKDYSKTYFPDYIERSNSNNQVVEKVKINKLSNLNRLYLIVTRHSASASELLINCLKPYMDVVLIGSTTYGKNVGSITIYEEDEEKQKTNTWGMQPIILKFENAQHFSDYGNGFKADVESDEFDFEDELQLLELGNVDEIMLSDALNHILSVKSLRKKNVTEKRKSVGSSIDRYPARKNMYIDLKLMAY